MQTITAGVPQTAAWAPPTFRSLSLSRARARAAVVSIAVVLALAFRTAGLATYGLSDDEINKVLAIEQYEAGRFSANAEHPMLMKLAMWASIDLSRGWNRVAPAGEAIALETAVRLPNAIAGAAITVVLYGVAEHLFGPAIGLAAALLWAFDVNATAINRIGKEDTFLLLFFLLAVWFYERAKRQGTTDPSGAQRSYASSGAAFGLMLASKYMPHYLGIYALFNAIAERHPGANRPDKGRYYGAMALAFLAANMAILSPATWRYVASYVQGGMLAHHGYLYAGQLYVTDVPVSALGVPATYYLRLIATKVPTVVLAAAIPGVIEMIRRRHERGFVLLRVLVVFLLVPYSLVAAKFMRYALPLLATIDLIAAVGLVAGIRWLLRKQWLRPMTRRTVAVLAVVVAGSALIADHEAAAPFYALFQNAIGERLAVPGATFPEETYDYGVREAVVVIASAARPAAVVVTDTPAVAAHYLRTSGRADLHVRSLSGQGLPPATQEAWVIVQPEHTTFENELLVRQLQQRVAPWREFLAGDVLAAQVFRIEGGARAANTDY